MLASILSLAVIGAGLLIADVVVSSVAARNADYVADKLELLISSQSTATTTTKSLVAAMFVSSAPVLVDSNVRVSTSIGQFPSASAPYVPSSGPADSFQQSETFVAVSPIDPRIVVVGFQDTRPMVQWGDQWLTIAVSFDGGQTFPLETLLNGWPNDPNGMQSPIQGNQVASDPQFAFDASGVLHAGILAFQRTPPGGKYTGSDNGNNPNSINALAEARYSINATAQTITFLGSGLVARGNNGVGNQVDYPVWFIDRNPASPFYNRVYVVSQPYSGGGNGALFQYHLSFAYSTDGGQTFTQTSNNGFPNVNNKADILPAGAVGPDGTIYLVWSECASAQGGQSSCQHLFCSSTDGGVTFSRKTVVNSFTNFGFDASNSPPQARSDSVNSIAVDDNGVVYIGWSQLGSSSLDVVVSRSTDQGATWNAPVVVHSGSSYGQQFAARISYSNGVLSAVWLDSRNDPTFTNKNSYYTLYDVYYSQADVSNSSAPLVFQREIRVTSVSSNSTMYVRGHWLHWDVPYFPFIGDYIGLSTDANYAYVSWTDMRDVNAPLNYQDMVTANVDYPPGQPLSTQASYIRQRARDANIYFQKIQK